MMFPTLKRYLFTSLILCSSLVLSPTSFADNGPHNGNHGGNLHNGPVPNGPVHNGPIHNGPIRNAPVHNGPVHNNGPVHGGGHHGGAPYPRHGNGHYHRGNGGFRGYGGYYGPAIIIGVPPVPYYTPCETVRVCDEFGACWLEEYCD